MTKQEIINDYLKRLNCINVKNIQDIQNLIQAHVNAFAFSSLKVLLKEEISLELEDIYESLVKNRRGGYCFEHNKLMYEALKHLGFDVQFYLARVVNNSQKDVPQTHRFTLLNYNKQRYIIDVGIGFRSPCVPITFHNQSTLSHLGIAYRIKNYADGSFGMELLEKNQWFQATKFDLNPCTQADFEMGHFYSYKHPRAVFVNNLVISRIAKACIHSLRNSVYIKMYEDHSEHIIIKSPTHLGQLLQDDFNICYSPKEVQFFYNNYVSAQGSHK